MRTFMVKKDQVARKWYVVDADGRVLGRIAARIATVLQGKLKPEYTPHAETGDFVVVVNARKVRVTGNKLKDKKYFHWSGYPGGLKAVPLEEMLRRHPERVIKEAVRRMLPKTNLGRKMFSRLKVYAGAEHPHAAQRPENLALS